MFLTGCVVGSSPTGGARGEVLIKNLMGAFLFCENVSFFHLVASTFYFKAGKNLVREMSSAVTHPKKHIIFQVL